MVDRPKITFPTRVLPATDYDVENPASETTPSKTRRGRTHHNIRNTITSLSVITIVAVLWYERHCQPSRVGMCLGVCVTISAAAVVVVVFVACVEH